MKGPSDKVQRSRRWPALRQQALRRDGYQCVQCGARAGLEVDHVKPVRDAPDLAFDLDNLQVLCKRHHSQKTKREMGLPELEGERLKWRLFLSS